MFYKCSNIELLNTSKFSTSKVSNMKGMFSGCNKLIFLNLTNFNIYAANMDEMFKNCKSLIYLNMDLKDFNILTSSSTNNIFDNLPDDIKYCIKGTYAGDFIVDKKINSQCESICFQNGKIVVENRNCTERCEYDEVYKFAFQWRCYSNCPPGSHISYEDDSICEEDERCPDFETDKEKCEKDTKDGHYFDRNDGTYKRCHNNCKRCTGPGDNNNNSCTECRPNLTNFDEAKKEYNCYKQCDFYYYFDNAGNYHCTNNDICPNDYPNIISSKKKCTHRCNKDKIYQFEFSQTCYDKCPEGTKSISPKKLCYYNNSSNLKDARIEENEEKILEIQENIMSGEYDDLLNNISIFGEDFIWPVDYDLNILITTPEIQRNNSNNNFSTINLGECENILRTVYKIKDGLPLIFKH